MDSRAFPIIISCTNVGLWENSIPEYMYNVLLNNEIIKTRNQIANVTRDNRILMRCFQDMYGRYLDRCSYAKVVLVPELLREYYSVRQIECYRNAKYPESVIINVRDCLSDYKKRDDYKEILMYLHNKTKLVSSLTMDVTYVLVMDSQYIHINSFL